MKKLLLVLMLAAGFVASALTQDAAKTPVWNHGDNVSDITYRNVVIYRVYNQQDATGFIKLNALRLRINAKANKPKD